MFKKFQSVIVFSFLFCLVFYTNVRANPNLEKEARFAAKVKTEILKLGTGAETRVNIQLRDKTKLRGYISETGDESFTIIEEKKQSAAKIPYSAVKQISGKNNLSGKTIVAVGILVLLIAVIALRGV